MSTKIEQAKSKLERIKEEQIENANAIRKEHDMIPFGQPNIYGRGDIYKKVNRHYEKATKLIEEQEKQEDRIKMLENIEAFKQENELLTDLHVVGSSEYAAIGAKTSVNNLDYFRNKLKQLEADNEKAKAYNKTKPKVKMRTLGAEITKLKRKIASLEEMEEKAQNTVLSSRTQSLIDSGAVSQWKKKPVFYFVKGLRKVALEIDDNGEFFISPYYPAWSKDDNDFVNTLLNKY
ncbi:hypothetical protein HCJ46_17180 [Listeria booriae]|uniref:hypothetical protein n=1 Tax=Listeria booriae TaxID=1552123 RepID=UPI001627C244|nr:hypothetical protein [Listeria booriae]MBC1920487.1 hypothetical protein [Listeria booriae]